MPTARKPHSVAELRNRFSGGHTVISDCKRAVSEGMPLVEDYKSEGGRWLFAMFPNEEVARQYLEGRLWPNGPVCPECKSGENVGVRPKGYYRCYTCDKLTFTVRTGTIFERSHIPLHKWVYAMYLLVTARKGISSMQLAKEIGVTQKSAWFMLSRLREACSTPDSIDKLRGIVEVDECFVGGLAANKHERKKQRLGRGTVGKTAVLGLRERGERTVAKVVPNRSIQTIQGEIFDTLERLDSFVDAVAGKRLTYKALIGEAP